MNVVKTGDDVMQRDQEHLAITKTSSRISSLDQFRGYTVFGMIVVNFLGAYACCPAVLKHWNTYCSYADTIMPHFFFAVGMSLHLVAVRSKAKALRETTIALHWAVYRKIIRRSLILMAIGAILYFPWFGKDLFSQLTRSAFWFGIIKRDWFQTLTHIGVTSIWVLPVIFAGNRIRFAWLIASMLLHVLLSHMFYFHWVFEKPTAIDGGPLGFLTWSIPVVSGMIMAQWVVPWPHVANQIGKTHEHVGLGSDMDLLTEETATVETSSSQSISLSRWLAAATLTMIAGYGMSCFTRLYDNESRRFEADKRLARQPVFPSTWTNLREESADEKSLPSDQPKDKPRSAATFGVFAEPPGVAPPTPELRAWNYWMMSQRAGTASYQLFASGLSMLVFVLFFYVSDMRGYTLGAFRTFGTNALMSYVVHGIVIEWVSDFLTKESSVWAVAFGLSCTVVLTYGVIRGMEHRGIRVVAR